MEYRPRASKRSIKIPILQEKTGKKNLPVMPSGHISALKLEAGTEAHRIFNKVWYTYNSFTAAELVKETTGKAWLKAITEKPHLLKNEYILEE